MKVGKAHQITVEDFFDFAEASVKQDDGTIPHPVSWIEENFIDPVTNKLVVLAPHQKRIIRRALQMDDEGRSRYSLVVWSEPKKSGKTTTAAAVGCYIAHNIEAPNEISTVANDQEQSAGRIFAGMQPTLTALGWKTPFNRSDRGANSKAVIDDPRAFGPNNTIIKAITTRYEKEAGANQGLSLWSELWAYKGERLTRLWEEMTPPPTRKFSMRWIETYAGFIDENILLQNIYLRVFKDFEESALQPGVVKIWPDLPVYELDGGKTLVYWSHEPRMPWQTSDYYISQRNDLRPSAYRRLHENRWVESDESFITIEMWNNSLRQTPVEEAAVYALDGSKNGDTTALVGSVRKGELVHTVGVYIWEPDDGQEVPYADIEAKIYSLFKSGLLIPPLYYDPYQLAYLAQRLRNKGIPCEEFNQGQLRVRADTFLEKMYKDGKIINTPSVDLRQHILAASIKEYEGQKIRILKPAEHTAGEESMRKVDAAVAQSMSVYKAYHRADGGWGASGAKSAQAVADVTIPIEIRKKAEFKDILVSGGMIPCKSYEYMEIRNILQELAGEFMDGGMDAIAQLALAEIQRLDRTFG